MMIAPRYLLAWLGIAVGVAGLGIDFSVIVGGLMAPSAGGAAPASLPYAVIYYFTFLTHLTNLGLVLTYLSTLAGWPWLGWFRSERTRAMFGGLIALVGLFYHFLLAPTFHLSGPIVYANVLLHYVSPVLYLIWWGVFCRHGGVRFRDIPPMLLAPFIYFLWTMLRGAVVHDYPYGIIDVDKLGYPLVAANAATVFVELAVLLVIVIGADLVLARRGLTETT
jgi:hypothetical protein